jgi:hypothetical protein
MKYFLSFLLKVTASIILCLVNPILSSIIISSSTIWTWPCILSSLGTVFWDLSVGWTDKCGDNYLLQKDAIFLRIIHLYNSVFCIIKPLINPQIEDNVDDDPLQYKTILNNKHLKYNIIKCYTSSVYYYLILVDKILN